MDKPPEGMAKVPEAIAKRLLTVQTHLGPIIVEKWSITRLTAIMSYMGSAIGNVSDIQIKAMVESGLPRIAAAHMITALGDRIPGMIELCVRLEDRPKIAEMDAEDALSVLDAAVELNMSEGLVGKVKALWLRFR